MSLLAVACGGDKKKTGSDGETTAVGDGSPPIAIEPGDDGGAVLAGDGAVIPSPGPRDEAPASAALIYGSCSSDGWCFERPYPTTETLRALWVRDDGGVWLVGEGGRILLHDGVGFRVTPSLGGSPHAIWASSDDDVWIVGSESTLLHHGAGGWSTWPLKARDTLAGQQALENQLALEAESGTDMEAAGDPSLDTDEGVEEPEPVVDFRAIWGSARDQIWAVGGAHAVWRFDGENWREVDTELKGGQTLHALWGTGPDNIWAAGDGARVLHFDGEQWSRESTGFSGSARVITGRASYDIWIGGTSLSHFDGELWHRIDLPFQSSIEAMAFEGDTLWVAGANGNLWTYDAPAAIAPPPPEAEPSTPTLDEPVVGPQDDPQPGEEEEAEPPPSPWHRKNTGLVQDLLALDQRGGTVWVAGEYGRVSSWRGETRTLWSVGNRGTHLAIVGSPGERASWVVGDGVLQLLGAQWHEIESPTTRGLHGGWMQSDTLAWAVGNGGTIVRFDGLNWQRSGSPTTRRLNSVWAANRGLAWAVGTRGTVLALFNGAWEERSDLRSQVVGFGLPELLGVWGVEVEDGVFHIWVVGSNGTIVRNDGLGWTAIPHQAQGELRAIWGTAPDDVWVSGSLGTLLHYDGEKFESTPGSGAGYSLNGLWGRAQDDVYAVGTGGTVLHFDGDDWHLEETGFDGVLNSVWGDPDGTVRAVGTDGAVLIKRP